MNKSDVTEYTPKFPGEVAIFRILSAAGGRHEGFQFVMQHQGDVNQIEAEIQEREELIAELQPGPMSPGATPRIYRDAYLAALREALNLIKEAQQAYKQS